MTFNNCLSARGYADRYTDIQKAFILDLDVARSDLFTQGLCYCNRAIQRFSDIGNSNVKMWLAETSFIFMITSIPHCNI